MVRRRKNERAIAPRSQPPASRPRTLPPHALPAEDLLMALPVPLALVQGGVVVWANAAIAAVLGYDDRAALIGSPLRALEDAPSPGVRPDGRGRGPAATERRTERWLRADGTPVTVEIVRTAISQGTLIAACDQPARAPALEGSPVPVDMLVAGIAHRINNPLAYMYADLAYLADQLPRVIDAARAGRDVGTETHELLQCVEEARHGSGRIARVVRELAVLAAGEEPGRMVDVNIAAVLGAAYEIVSSQLQARARVLLELGETPPVRASEARLAQVFVGLLLQASSAIPEGAPDRHDLRIVASTDDAGRAAVTMSGDSIVDSELTRLELAICRRIVGQWGGRLDVSAEGDRGHFRVLLPPSRSRSGEASGGDRV